MNIDMNTVRLLGAAQLLVFAASMVSERLLISVVGSGSTSDILVNVSKNLNRLRVSNLVALVNSAAILILGVMFYIVFYEKYPIISLVALGCFMAEGITLAMSKIGTYALIPLSQEFVEAGAPEASPYQTLGRFLYNGVDRQGYDIHMWFFCLGGILWYYLLYVSGVVPTALALWGLIAVCLMTIAVLLVLYNPKFSPAMVVGLLYLPYEVVLGVWLIVKGFN